MTAQPPIRRLPPAVAARIAAGEVIERPASVVKELVENAIDAGARRIRIDVRGAGLTLLRVGDDGRGIPSDQLPLAVQRHATSKLIDDDLGQVRSLGFRGEALPSIAAVAELTLVSADRPGGLGRRLTLRDGRIVADEPAPQPPGTTVTVQALFANLPARLASIAQPSTELSQIAQTVRRLALAAPAVRLILLVDEQPRLQTSGSGDLATALVELYGAGLAGHLLSLGPLTVAGAQLNGLISAPTLTRPGRQQLHVIVNGRWAPPRGLLAQLEAAYRPLLPRGRHPLLVLQITTAPERVDINIHPAKLEVRLLDERAIGTALAERLRHRLGSQPRTPALVDLLAPLPVLGLAAGRLAIGEAPIGWDEAPPIITPGLPPLRLLGQLQQRLLLLEGDDGLYLIDQHRAHERIIYERLRTGYAGGGPEPVALPEPLLIELSPAQARRLNPRLDQLAEFGLHCRRLGDRRFLLQTAPRLPGLDPARPAGPTDDDRLAGLGEPAGLAPGLLALLDEPAADGEDWSERLLISLACRTALRRGRPLDRPTMRALVEHLGQTAAPAVCPHGSPLLLQINGDRLAQHFDW